MAKENEWFGLEMMFANLLPLAEPLDESPAGERAWIKARSISNRSSTTNGRHAPQGGRELRALPAARQN